jgi:uncharacterized membrane protein
VVLAVLMAATLIVGAPTHALAKSFELPEAQVVVEVQPDGSLRVTEHITFAFQGPFQGAYRDIPMQAGESVVDVRVSEGGTSYRPGAPTRLGSTGEPGTFGVEDLGSTMRVVWHYRATDEVRVFTISYGMTGVSEAHDDVVDVYFQVWGRHWEQSLGRLSASGVLPGSPTPGQVHVFGHPAVVSGRVGLGSDGVSPELVAFGVPPGQFVELRMVFPRELLTSTTGAVVRPGTGLETIMAQEVEEARRAAEELEAVRRLRERWPWFVLLAFLPAVVAIVALYYRAGREPRVDYDREYEQGPPTDHSPAVVGALMDQRIRVGPAEFTATLFDLIRRGVLTARQVSLERKTWGGLRTEMISDLEIGPGKESELGSHETPVMAIQKRVLDGVPRPLSEFRHLIREDAQSNAKSYREFQSRVRKEVRQAGLFDRRPWLWVVGILLLLLGAVLLFGILGVWTLDRPTPALARGTLFLILAGAAFVNLLLFGMFALWRTGWVRRSKQGALVAARWQAFRRFLRDFSRLEEAPPASLALWEEYLVYGIALGVAEDVLEAARLHAPPVVEQSHLYWYGSDGYGGGLTGNAINGIERSLATAFRPPSSGSGGFSGGGGGGSGGGGGGAW